MLDWVPCRKIDNRCAPCGCAYFDVKLDDNGKFDPEFIAGTVRAQKCPNSGRNG